MQTSPVTTDTLLLGSYLSVPPGSHVVELGSAGGGAMEFSSRRNRACAWTGIDKRIDSLHGLLRSGTSWKDAADVRAVCCRVERVMWIFPASVADAVMANPPYGTTGRGRSCKDPSRQISRTGDALLCQHFIRAASHLLVDGGVFVTVNVPPALPRILLGCAAWDLTPMELQPVGPPGMPSKRILVMAVKGSAGELVIKPQITALECIRSKEG